MQTNRFVELIATLLGAQNPHVLTVHSGFCAPCALHSVPTNQFSKHFK